MDKPLDPDEIRGIIIPALNADSGDAEFSALHEIADMVGIEYDDDTQKYFFTK